MSHNPLTDVVPEGLRRLLEEQADQAAKMQRLLEPSFQAAQDALRHFGGIGLRQETLQALPKFLAPPTLDLSHLSGIHLQAADAMARLDADLEKQVSAFREIGNTLARALEIPSFLRGLNLPTADEFEEGHRSLLHNAEALARTGWTFAPEMTPAEIAELVERHTGKHPTAIDRWFLAYYAAPRGREFRALASRLCTKTRLATWRPLLRECLWAFRRDRYRLAIPALLATVEGLVCEVTGTIREKGVNASKHWQERAAKPPKGFMVEIEWCATAAFLETLWCRSDFGGPAPDNLNRHWVLHGRYPRIGGRADALRLLAAVDFIADAVQNIESLTKSLDKSHRKRRA